jgi:hypothetical protein
MKTVYTNMCTATAQSVVLLWVVADMILGDTEGLSLGAHITLKVCMARPDTGLHRLVCDFWLLLSSR